MSICVPRWYLDEMQEFALPTTHERNTMSEQTTKTVSTEDFNAAMRLLGLSEDPHLALMSVEIRDGAVMAEYRQRVRVVYDETFQIRRGGPKFPVPSPPADPVPVDGQCVSISHDRFGASLHCELPADHAGNHQQWMGTHSPAQEWGP